MRSWACWAISAPWSQVSDRRRWSGSVKIETAIASRTASAPCPASAGPLWIRGPWPWPSMRGRCSSMVNRVVRSTRDPIAELPRPKMRSPSQCPGTARSSASAGRGSRPARRPPRAQARGQLPAQRTTALHVERLVDGLVRDPHRLILREVNPQSVRDLLRAPRPRPTPILAPPVSTTDPGHIGTRHELAVRPGDPPREAVLHVLAKPFVLGELGDLRAAGTPLCVPLRCRRPVLEAIRASGGVAAELPRDR